MRFPKLVRSALVDLGEDDDQGEEREGFHEGQTQGEQQQDAGTRSWIARQGFRGGSGRTALTEAAKAGGEAHSETSSERGESGANSSLARRLGKGRNRQEQDG